MPITTRAASVPHRRRLQFEKEAKAALVLPPGSHSYALGYPMGRFGPVQRVPLADVVYKDRWGQAYRDRSGLTALFHD